MNNGLLFSMFLDLRHTPIFKGGMWMCKHEIQSSSPVSSDDACLYLGTAHSWDFCPKSRPKRETVNSKCFKCYCLHLRTGHCIGEIKDCPESVPTRETPQLFQMILTVCIWAQPPVKIEIVSKTVIPKLFFLCC